MASTVASTISDAPLTDKLAAPPEEQRVDDFRSTTTSRSTSSTENRMNDNIEWSRLYGYIATPRVSKRPKSFI
jgi:hypothetical protein